MAFLFIVLPTVNRLCTAFLCGRAGRVTALFGGLGLSSPQVLPGRHRAPSECVQCGCGRWRWVLERRRAPVDGGADGAAARNSGAALGGRREPQPAAVPRGQGGGEAVTCDGWWRGCLPSGDTLRGPRGEEICQAGVCGPPLTEMNDLPALSQGRETTIHSVYKQLFDVLITTHGRRNTGRLSASAGSVAWKY